MKKLFLIIILSFLFLPLVANAESCNTNKVSISSITIENKSDTVEELTEATANNRNINLDLSMSEVGDNIKYKIIIKNDSNEDYTIDKSKFNIDSDYISYTFKPEDNSNTIKANSSKTIFLRVEYKTEIPENLFNSGIYSNKKDMKINLSNANTKNTLKNPNTSNFILKIILILFIVGVITLIIIKSKKRVKYMILIIGTIMISLPFAYALCQLDLRIESNVIVESKTKYLVKGGFMFGEPIDQANAKNTPREAMLDWGPRESSQYLKVVLNKNKEIEKGYVEFIITEEMAEAVPELTPGTYSLRGGENEESLSEKPIYNANKEVLIKAFDSSNCVEYSNNFQCNVPNIRGLVYEKGYVDYSNGLYACYIWSTREGHCAYGK